MTDPFVRSQRYVFTVEQNDKRYKLFQVGFQKSDGTLQVSFPYHKNPEALLSVVGIAGGGSYPRDIDLKQEATTVSKQLKYAHHPDGECHFSGDGKVRTTIRRTGVPLDEVQGHIFTINFTNFSDFEQVSKKKDLDQLGETRTVYNASITNEKRLKFVGRWYKTSDLRPGEGTETTTRFAIQTSSGIQTGFLLLPPPLSPMAEYCLSISIAAFPEKLADESAIGFIGGFDRADIASNPSVDTELLVYSSPIPDYAKLRAELGSADFVEGEVV